MTASTQPDFSVVIASIVGKKFIDDCLESVRDQSARCGAEVLVVACGTREHADGIGRRHPWVKVIHRSERETVPELRRVGVDHSRGSVIAIIEEHCVADPGWLDSVTLAMANGGGAVVGGAVAPDAYDRVADWVVYFCEYNISMPPAPRGEVDFLNGANIAYARTMLTAHAGLLGSGYWEAVLHPVLIAEGVRLISVPEMVVRHRGPFPFLYYLRQRFWFSRAFAGARQTTPLRRIAYLVAAPVIPALLLVRMGLRVAAKRTHVKEFVKAVPLIIPALIFYVAGEWVGYLAGPGDALSMVE